MVDDTLPSITTVIKETIIWVALHGKNCLIVAKVAFSLGPDYVTPTLWSELFVSRLTFVLFFLCLDSASSVPRYTFCVNKCHIYIIVHKVFVIRYSDLGCLKAYDLHFFHAKFHGTGSNGFAATHI